MVKTTYLAPESVREALLLLLKHGNKSRLIAGGSDVLVPPEARASFPGYLISLERIRNLDYIRYDESGGLKIGALTTIGTLEKNALIKEKYDILAQAAGVLGTPAVRNRATIGGNLCNAAPSADCAPALMVLGAKLKINSVDKEWVTSIEDFFSGPGGTVIKPGQLLTEIQIPKPPPGSTGVYLKHTRNRGADLALVGVAVLIRLKNGILEDIRIALGAVAPTPIRAKKAEAVLKGRALTDGLLKEAAQVAVSETSCIDDVRCSAEYRRSLVSTLLKRAVIEAAEKAKREI